MTTRERKIAFIESFGPNAIITAIAEYYEREGVHWLTDEQLGVIALRLEARRKNREVAASARRGRDEAAA